MSYFGFGSLAAMVCAIQRMSERDELVERVIAGEGLAEGQKPIELLPDLGKNEDG